MGCLDVSENPSMYRQKYRIIYRRKEKYFLAFS
jgi:hypothetical protein